MSENYAVYMHRFPNGKVYITGGYRWMYADKLETEKNIGVFV